MNYHKKTWLAWKKWLLAVWIAAAWPVFAAETAKPQTEPMVQKIQTADAAASETVTTIVAAPSESLAQVMAANNFQAKRTALEQLAMANPSHAADFFRALADGRVVGDGKNLWLKSESGQAYTLWDAPQQKVAKPAGSKKITINNNIRQWLRGRLAQDGLTSSNVEDRRAAIKNLLAQNDEAALAQVQAALPSETSADVRKLMESYIARADLASNDTSRHVSAIKVLQQSASPENLALLQSYIERAPTTELKIQAKRAISSIETQQNVLKGVEMLSFGLSLGSVLVLTAIGLAITFGVMGVINMAHGELMMLGAYCAYVVQLMMPNHIGWSIAVALPVAFVVSALVGIVIERLVVRHLYGRPLETLLATFGISLILQQAVRSIFSPLNRMVQTPEWMSGAWQIADGLSITWNRIYIFGFCMLCFLLLLAIMKYTRLGLEVRAVSMNRHMARAVGISDRKVDMLTFGLGSGVAGVAGVALSQLTNVGPNLGQQYIVDSFMVVVVGGVGNLWGTLVSGLGLGVINKFFEPWLGAVLAKAVLLVLIILFIQKYPRGLFPQKGRGVE